MIEEETRLFWTIVRTVRLARRSGDLTREMLADAEDDLTLIGVMAERKALANAALMAAEDFARIGRGLAA